MPVCSGLPVGDPVTLPGGEPLGWPLLPPGLEAPEGPEVPPAALPPLPEPLPVPRTLWTRSPTGVLPPWQPPTTWSGRARRRPHLQELHDE